jgi:hypothetical protein
MPPASSGAVPARRVFLVATLLAPAPPRRGRPNAPLPPHVIQSLKRRPLMPPQGSEKASGGGPKRAAPPLRSPMRVPTAACRCPLAWTRLKGRPPPHGLLAACGRRPQGKLPPFRPPAPSALPFSRPARSSPRLKGGPPQPQPPRPLRRATPDSVPSAPALPAPPPTPAALPISHKHTRPGTLPAAAPWRAAPFPARP